MRSLLAPTCRKTARNIRLAHFASKSAKAILRLAFDRQESTYQYLPPKICIFLPTRYTAGFGDELQARSSSILSNRKLSQATFMKLNRRSFIAASAATVIASHVKAAPSIRDVNDRIGVCTIGFHGQGGSHINDILKMKDQAEYVAICDVDSDVLEHGAAIIEKAQGKKPRMYRDIHKALADKEVHAVTIATPNHWHSLAATWACEAGKDVYVEKPMSHNIFEGQQVVAAAKKYGKIVQHGTQSRANPQLIRD